jgi:hypothetical protein
LLNEAVRVSRDTVATTPPGHADHAGHLSNLGSVLCAVFVRTGEPAVLQEAIQVGREGVAASPSDNPNHAMYLSNLGTALSLLFRLTGERAVLAEGRECYTAATDALAAPVDLRVAAAHAAAELSLAAGDHDHAMAMVELAAGLLGLLTPRRLQRSDRQHRITSVSGLANTVATAAIAAGRLERAVELLEQVRGRLITDTPRHPR